MHLFADTGKIIDKFFRLNQIVIYQTEDGQTQIRKTRSHIKIWIKQAFLSKTILFTPHLDENCSIFVQIYTNLPAMSEVFPRQRFEAQIATLYSNEKAFLANNDDLQLLFLLHGKSLPIGKVENDDPSDNGYPQHCVIVTSYGKTDDDYGFELL